jgi:hypothetical protein
MKLQLENGIELEISDGSQVAISEDGKRISVKTAEPKVVETIRTVEISSDQETIRFIPGPETIRIVEVEKPCSRQHYDHQHWIYGTNPYTWPGSTITVRSSSQGVASDPNQSYTIGGMNTGNITYTSSAGNVSIS